MARTERIEQPVAQARADRLRRGSLLCAQNLHRVLGDGDAATDILKGVNVSIGRGEYVSIVGASGRARARCSICSAASIGRRG